MLREWALVVLVVCSCAGASGDEEKWRPLRGGVVQSPYAFRLPTFWKRAVSGSPYDFRLPSFKRNRDDVAQLLRLPTPD